MLSIRVILSISALAINYRFTSGFEVEGGYSHYTVSSLSPLSTDGTFPILNGSRLNVQSGGGRDEYSGTVNAFYDLQNWGAWVPYVGVGGGVDTINAETVVVAGPGGIPRFTEVGGNATDAVILGEVGVSLALDEKWSVVPSYRFQHVSPMARPSPTTPIYSKSASAIRRKRGFF